ncbi:tetratricopeptide repeat protein [Telmatobacter sp. DSM 110680]|uniref:Tetratricopeptide repeat protein n=1 Tax=Telmatobacter sp. DSM 110680 TaxID=3036704 RepID=A0AAU7DDI0_9BACT
MRSQSIPALPLLFALASLFVTPWMLNAQPSGGVTGDPTDPVISSRAANSLPSNLASGTTGSDRSLPQPGDSATIATTQVKLSLKALNDLLEEYRKTGDRPSEAHTLGAIASSYNALHQQQKAVQLFQAELNLWCALDDKKNEATTLAHLGDVYREWGFPDQAIHFYREALKTDPDPGGKLEQAAIFNNLGLAYFALRDKKKCLEYLDQSLAIYRAAQNPLGQARALTNLGSTYGFLINDPHKAIDYFQEAVTRLELLNDRSTEANALELMGGVWLKLQMQDMAVESYHRALFLFERIGDAQGEASVRKQLSAVGDNDSIASAR